MGHRMAGVVGDYDNTSEGARRQATAVPRDTTSNYHAKTPRGRGGHPPRRCVGLRSWTHIATSHILTLITGFWVWIISRGGKRVSWVHDVELWPDVDYLVCGPGNGDEHFFQV